jgi:hypothetical protein
MASGCASRSFVNSSRSHLVPWFLQQPAVEVIE